MYHTRYKFKLDPIFHYKEIWFCFWVGNQGVLKMLSPQNRLQFQREMLFLENAVLVWISMGFQSNWYPSGTLLMRVLCCGVLQCVVVCCMFVASSKLLWNPLDIHTSWKQSIFIWICIVRYQKMLSPQNRLQLPLEMLFWENAVLGWISMGFHKSWKQSMLIWICIARYQKIWFFWGLVIKGVATHCNTQQHTATHCNTQKAVTTNGYQGGSYPLSVEIVIWFWIAAPWKSTKSRNSDFSVSCDT